MGARINQIQPKVEHSVPKDATLYTDESGAYNRVKESGRKHGTVNHSQKEFARDDDGDGINEVHCNSCEGLWTGVVTLYEYLEEFIKSTLHNTSLFLKMHIILTTNL